MDYSLLVGLHFREISTAGDLIPSGARTPTGHFSHFHKINIVYFTYKNGPLSFLQVTPTVKELLVFLEQTWISFF